MTQASAAEVAGALRGRDSVMIISHVRPDPDTIGSALGLGLGLAAIGVDVRCGFAEPDTLPGSLHDLPGTELLAPLTSPAPGEAVVAVDAATLNRLGSYEEFFAAADLGVCIDHHVSNTGFGDVAYIDAESDCTAVLVLRVLDELGVEVTADIATCLYAGLVTDTGSFKWARPASFAVAARLLESGVDAPKWSRVLLDSHPYSWLQMVSAVLGTSRLDEQACDGRGLVYAMVTEDQMAGLAWDESESVIDVVRTAREAEVAAVFKEAAPGEWRVSLRSKTSVDLVPIASSLGGGGHTRAAGYSDSGTADEVVARLRAKL
ncbi:bifunctional oligoribonuclease/PAP phosphatase NrnA [Gordonia sp. HY002]|uniref:DHH family phosphoesterase n=1 Tax=Gordonia zhenghanii TaxID=2911516 RepID=UPI001EEFC317|nr:bifunctional oligoribonuclease/PAP phosphatase NrnA [Gordonia zhenghanii]MCF8569584.1 bifunctional oligoribonuclease/PAP phosphatase NrnA [Gordonia zhenghanii]MCF8602895.1 bifunctional oligoribonuclease/PAP phosphatase NrnA [Gordonia zhenghanii]